MSRADRLFLCFCMRPRLKACCALVLGATGLLWPPLLALALLVPLADWHGARLVRHYHPSFRDDLEEQLTAACLLSCGIHAGEHHYVFAKPSGGIDHWLLRGVADTLRVDVLAPKRDYVVMSGGEGGIFPPNELIPPRFTTTDLGCVEVYYRDIDMVQLENGTLRLHTLGGREHEFPAHQGTALEAAQYLRQRLRDYKARVSDGFSA